MRQYKHDYDAFISHAVEDKIPIANELCAKLERAGLRIWYSGKELGIGDSIEKTIESGLHRSRYGIVILSPTYLAKNWTIREFYTLLAKEIEEQKVILPVLYNVTLEELKNKDMLMADRFAVNADHGIDHVVERLVREIRKSTPQKKKIAWFSRIWAVLILSLLANVVLVVKGVFPERDGFLPGPANMHGAEPINANLFHEMQGLFTRLSTCSCNDGAPRRSPAIKNRMEGTRPERVQVAAREDPVEKRIVPRRNRGKMTMAVVFQIESLSDTESTRDFGQDVDEMMESVNMADDSPFITVSNHETEKKQRACLHTVADAGE